MTTAELVPCACWCGELITPLGSKGRARRFAPYHYLASHLSEAWGRLMRPDTDVTDDCWEWPGGVNNKGYGVTKRNGENYAHRAAWVQVNGPIPDGLDACHHCDNPPCFRPRHLFLGTQADNMQDMARKGRWGNQGPPPVDVPGLIAAYESGVPLRRVCRQFGTSLERARQLLVEHGVRIRRAPGETRVPATTCKAGHPLDEVNTYTWAKRGTRQCRACAACRQRGYDAKRRAAS